MKSLIIKIGKAIGVFKREGLIKGGKRLIKSGFGFILLLKPLEKGDVLFITGGVGDSARYRTHNVAEELEINGINARVTIQDNPFLIKYVDKFKVFVFHRVLMTKKVRKIIEELKKQGKEIIFETDDLLYDPEYLNHVDYLQNINPLEKPLYENGLGGDIVNNPYVKVCTTTTLYLAEKLEKRGKKVFVVKNKLNKWDIELMDEILKNKPASHGKIRIGYFSGTASHNKDFGTITDVLARILEKHSDVELFLAGPLEIEEKLKIFENQIKQVPFMSREKMYGEMALMDINLAPLEIGNPFCESKSELKWFEAGALEVPTVAAGTGPFREAISDGADGFVAGSEEEWMEKLERLIENPELRKTMGENARKKVLKEYTTANSQSSEYYGYLKARML